MKPGDYLERKRAARSGKVVTDKVVKSTTGEEYAVGSKLGAGGVASVFRALRLRDGKECVFKEYAASTEKMRMHIAIKRNIQNLMNRPLTEDDGTTPLRSFIGPLDKDSLIPLTVSGGFGYVMELVDTKAFLPIPKLWHADKYPDADILCKACINIAHLFRRVHVSGLCYKDINEGNIYINNKTGDVRIIDCDNISVQSTKTIKGTDGFMAPEVYVNSTPDMYTDYFSVAVLFYRLLIGGYPLDGKRTKDYLMTNNLSVQEAAPTIYGTMALFAFDPNDRSNEIRKLVDPKASQMYELQTKSWDRLPVEVREGFVKTFSTGLKECDRHKRATDKDWIDIFERVASRYLVRCSCGRMNFGDEHGTNKCIFCQSQLPPVKPNYTPELTTVVFSARRDIAPPGLKIVASRKQLLPGNAIYPGFHNGWMRIEYSRKLNKLSAVNQGRDTWTIIDNGVKASCAPRGRVVFKIGQVIIVRPRQLQLKVIDIK